MKYSTYYANLQEFKLYECYSVNVPSRKWNGRMFTYKRSRVSVDQQSNCCCCCIPLQRDAWASVVIFVKVKRLQWYFQTEINFNRNVVLSTRLTIHWCVEIYKIMCLEIENYLVNCNIHWHKIVNMRTIKMPACIIIGPKSGNIVCG